ncbi:MAG: hypothetical protein ACRDNS_13075 [Trebonia sp.]
MSRGLGKTQKAILDTLVGNNQFAMLTDLAECVNISARQARRAVHALRDRGLVVAKVMPGDWKGWGQYGTVRMVGWFDGEVWRSTGGTREQIEDASICVPAGQRAPDGRAYRHDSRWERSGMPVGLAMCVWTIERYANILEYKQQLREAREHGTPRPSWSPA